MNPCKDVIHQCFEAVANADVDLSPKVYQQFSKAAPESDKHMETADDNIKGRMLEQVYNLLLDDVEEGYLAFETRMHQGYGANIAFYRALLMAVKAAVQDVMGESWTAKEEHAWNGKIAAIICEIGAVTPDS